MDLSAIALQGLNQAQTQFGRAANQLASLASAPPDSPNPDSLDLSSQAVSLLSAKNAFELNLGVMKVANEIEHSAIDLLA